MVDLDTLRQRRSLDATHDDLVARGLRLGDAGHGARGVAAGRAASYARTFADVGPGALLLYEDAAGALALAVNGGDATALLGAAGAATRCAWSAA